MSSSCSARASSRVARRLLLATILGGSAGVHAQVIPAELEPCLVDGIDELGVQGGVQLAGGGGGWLLMWPTESQPKSVHTARITRDGSLLGENYFETTDSRRALYSHSVAGGEEAWLVLLADGLDVGPGGSELLGQTDLHAVRLDADGSALEETRTTLAAAPESYDQDARAAWLDGTWLIAWAAIDPNYFVLRDTDRIDGADIFAVRMNAAGTILDDAPLHLAMRPPNNGEGGPLIPLHVSAGEESWLVVFEYYNDELDVESRAVRVRGDTLLDSGPILITARRRPYAVARNGAGWLVAAATLYPEPVDNELIRVAADGSVAERIAVPRGVKLALAESEEHTLVTWSVALESGGSELRGWLYEPGIELDAAETFVLATTRDESGLEAALAAGSGGEVLAWISGSAGQFALRVDPGAEGGSCVEQPAGAMDAGVRPAARDAGADADPEVDAATDSGRTPERDAAATTDAGSDAATAREESDDDEDDGGCSVANTPRGAADGVWIYPLLLALVAVRMRRHRRKGT